MEKLGTISASIRYVCRQRLLLPLFFIGLGIFLSGDCPLFIGESQAQGFGAGRSRDSIFRGRGRRGRQRSSKPRGQDNAPPPQQGGAQPPPPVRQIPQVLPPQARPAAGQRPQARPAQPGQPAPPGGQPGKAGSGIPPKGELVLRLVPHERMVKVGAEFPLHVWLDNPKKKPFDVISFGLLYDPQVLEFVDAPGGSGGLPNSHDIAERITANLPLARDSKSDPFYLNYANTDEGMVYYRARCAPSENAKGEGFVISMRFKALSAARHTGIRFLFSAWPRGLEPPVQSDQTWAWPESLTFVGATKDESGEKSVWSNLLGSTASLVDGVIHGSLAVKGDGAVEEILEEEEPPVGLMGTRIYIEPSQVALTAGETTDLNLKVHNPGGVAWDRIRMDLRFDPRFLEIVDQDEGNWITRGTNILDGPYHDRFPFEWMRTNQVEEEEGIIHYQCGVFMSPFKSQGTVATVRVKAIRPVPETMLRFVTPTKAGSLRGTVLERSRVDVLGLAGEPRDGASGCTLTIVPARSLTAAKDPGEPGR